MSFSTTIKKEWWEKKMEQYEVKEHFYEYKECRPYWNKRISNLKLPADAVFLVGSVPYRAKITEILRAKMEHIPADVMYFFMLKNAMDEDMLPNEVRNSKVWILKCEDVRGDEQCR